MHLPLLEALLPPLQGELDGHLPPSSCTTLSISSSSLVTGFALSSSSDSSEGESYKKQYKLCINMDLCHKVIEKKRK